jgi:hypothetical protein
MLLTPKDVGILVDHTVWRRGKVIDISSPYAIIHFPSLADSPDGPRRKLREDAAQITKASEQSDPVLDLIETGLAQPKARKPRAKTSVTNHFDEALAWFKETHPAGFNDERFLDADLRNKRSAHDVFVATFGEGKAQAMIAAGQHVEVSDVLDSLFRSTNVLSPFEVKAVHKALKNNPEAGSKVLQTAMTFSATPTSSTFTQLVEAIAQLATDGAKVMTWPIVTLLPFVAEPRKFIALKPTNSELMAARLEYDLKYETTPNWQTFDSMNRMCQSLLEKLAPLGAKDLIDVQGFMWVTRELD